jgi:hypothetical protein
MDVVAKISPWIPSPFGQNANLSLQIMHIIPSHHINVAIDNPSLVPSISCCTTSSYLQNDVRTAYNGYHADISQSNGWGCFSLWYKF